jgi:hypothetical protein
MEDGIAHHAEQRFADGEPAKQHGAEQIDRS